MRACGPDANETLTGEQRRHPLGRLSVRRGQQVRVGVEHRGGIVAQAGGRDVARNPAREQVRRVGVAQGVQRPGGETGRLPLLAEPRGEPLRVDRAAELVADTKSAST